jgi:peptidyl-prolyl cis-trans isomerase B (cyclophilin B)
VAKQEAPRRGGQVAGAIIAAVLVIGGMIYLSGAVKGEPTPVAGAKCTWTENTTPQVAQYLKKTGTPPKTGNPDAGTRAMVLDTNRGKITVTLDVTTSPCAAASFAYLAGKGYFDKTTCHRITTDGIYVLQCGDPTGTGAGGPEYTFPAENLPTGTDGYPRGIVAMANPGDPNANGSQFFIVYKTAAPGSLANNYTIIGTVTGGMDVVDKVAAAGATVNPQDPNASPPKLPVNIGTVTVDPVT